MGDDVKKVAEAAGFAKKLIGCTILENTPYYRSSGHVQVGARLALRCCIPGAAAAVTWTPCLFTMTSYSPTSVCNGPIVKCGLCLR